MVGLWVKVWIAEQESNIGFDSKERSHGFEKSNDFSGEVCFGRKEVLVAGQESENLTEKSTFFLRNLFKLHFFEDNNLCKHKFM